MKINTILFFLMYFMLNTSFIIYTDSVQDDWTYVTSHKQLKVYKRTKKGSKFKEVKIINTFEAQIEDMIHEIDDLDNYSNWVFKCTESYTVERISPSEIICYNFIDMPYPVWDRDMVTYSKYWYDKKTETHYYESETASNDESYLPAKDNVVRIEAYNSLWSIKDIGNNQIRSINILHMEPGGNIPAWINNMAIAKGPINSMEALQGILDVK